MGKYIGATTSPVLKKNNHWMTQAFNDGKKDKKKKHNGIDLINRGKVLIGTTADYIISIAEGEITYTGYSNTRGYYVEMKHKNGFKTRYLHMKKGSIVVKKGQYVQKGTTLGYMGATGEGVTGKHLHLAVINTKDKYVDPLPYLLGSKNFDKVVNKNAYQVYDIKKKKWLPKVNVDEDLFAGTIGDKISGIYLDKGEMRVHTHGGKWLPAVIDHNDYAGILSKKIDGIAIKGFKYRVHIYKGGWLPYVDGYDINDINNGFAGILGKDIDGLQIKKK